MPAFRTWSESTGAKRDWNDDIVDLIRIPVFWTEFDVVFHSLGSERAKGKGWVAP